MIVKRNEDIMKNKILIISQCAQCKFCIFNKKVKKHFCSCFFDDTTYSLTVILENTFNIPDFCPLKDYNS